MRSRNDIAVIETTLDALLAQDWQDFEVIALDNDSTDGTREAYLARGIDPIRVPAGTYNPGRVLAQGVEASRGEMVVFLNSDTSPANCAFLRALTEPLRSGEADAVYGRQLPRHDATTLVRLDHARAFGASAPAWGPFFSLAASAFPRQLLRERPLPRHVQYSEDLAWAVAAARDGLRIAYAPKAMAVHSHNYTLRETWKRYFEEGRADAVIFSDAPGRPLRPLASVLGVALDVARDAPHCLSEHDLASLLRSPAVRGTQRIAYLVGRLAGPRKDLSA
jgi:rhamnosyltransferase